jgi:hypothetical protein
MEGKENDWKKGFQFVFYVYNNVVRGHTGSMWNTEKGGSAFLRNVFTYR